VNPSSGLTKQITGLLSGLRSLRWSPDGKYFAYSFSPLQGIYQIMITKSDGSGQPVKVAEFGAPTDVGSWSPDGSKILFASMRTGNFDLYIINADGAGLTQLPGTAVGEFYPSWQP
jgi:Tol biopolymer transport system component